MAFKREWVDPNNFVTRLGNLADDGTDWEIIFESGLYTLVTDLTIQFRNGGHLVFKSHLPRQAILTGSIGLSKVLRMNAVKMGFHGFHLLGTPFSAPATTGGVGIVVILSGEEVNPPVNTANYTLNFPQQIHVTDVLSEGWSSAFNIKCSNSPLIYTDVYVADCEQIDADHHVINGLFDVNIGLEQDAYAHVVLSGNKAFNRNGPIQSSGVGDGPAWGGVNAVHHATNTIAFDIAHLAGVSTYLEVGSDFTAELWGSENHDMHCVRMHFVRSKDVVMHWKDCRYIGNWRAGHISGDGGGNLWVFYIHAGGADYPTFNDDDRPHLTFDNCLFRTTYYPGIPHEDITLTPGAGFSTVQIQSSSTTNFFDCRFEIIDNSGISSNPLATAGNALTALVTYCLDPQPATALSTTVNNCSFVLPSLTTHPTAEVRVNNEPACVSALKFATVDTLGHGPTDFLRGVSLSRHDLLSTVITGFNGDQEIDTDSNGVPDGWTVVADDPKAFLTTAQAHPSPLPVEHGPTAMRFRGAEGLPADVEDEAFFTIPASGRFLEAGRQFMWSYWLNAMDAKSQPSNPIDFEVHYQFDADGWVLAETFNGNDAPFGWFKRINFSTPGLAKANFHIRFRAVVVGGIPGGLHTEDYWADLIECTVLGV